MIESNFSIIRTFVLFFHSVILLYIWKTNFTEGATKDLVR